MDLPQISAAEQVPRRAFPRTPPLSLSANLLWTLAGNAIYSACQWGMLVGIIRIGHADLAGKYALGLALTAPLFMLTNMQMSGLLATDGGGQFEFADYQRVRWIGSAVALAAALTITLAVPAYRVAAGAVTLMALAKLVESASDINYGLLQRYHRMDRVAIGLVARGVLALLALVVVLRLTGSLTLAIAALATAYAVVYWLYDGRAEHAVGERSARDAGVAARGFEAARLLTLTRLALPLGVASMLTSVAVTLPRLFVEHFFGLSALGVFSALAYLVVAGRLLALPFGLAVAPRLGDALAARDFRTFNRLFSWLLAAGAVLGALGIVGSLLLGPWGLRLLYGPAFARYGLELTMLMTAAAFGYLAIFLQSALTIARIVAAQTWLIAVSLVTTAAALALLVPQLGILGATIAMAIGSAFEMLGSAVVVAWCWRRVFAPAA